MQISSFYSSGLPSNYSTPSSRTTQAVSNGDSANPSPASSGSYTVSLSAEALLAAQNEQERSTASSTTSDDGWNWTTSSAGISHATGPDGHEWKRIDLNQVLTPEDKNLVGWPATNNPAAQQAALFIALDRADGHLQGAVTREYLEGNKEKNIAGLAERSPVISQSAVSDFLKRLG